MGGDLPDVVITRTPAQKALLLFSTVICTAYCLVGGSLYAFPSFSNALQHYGYTHVALLGSLGNCGMFVMGFFAGVSIDRFGQKLVCIVGVILIAAGYLMLRGSVLGGLSETFVGFSLFVIGTGGISSLMAMLTWQQSQYSVANRGKITALLLAAYCLSGALWAPIYEANYPLDAQLPDYCILIVSVALVLGAVVIALTGEWRIGSDAPHPAGAVPAATAATSDANAIASGAVVTPEAQAAALPWEKRGTGADSIGMPSASFGKDDDNVVVEASAADAAGKQAPASASSLSQPHPTTASGSPPDEGPAPTVLSVVFCLSRYSVFFWLLYAPVFVILGSAFVLVNNTALLIDSLRGFNDVNGSSATLAAGEVSSAFYVQQITVVFGICNAVFRVGGGWITDIISARGFSRLWVLLVAASFAVIACLVLASAGLTGLMTGNILMGVADGLCFAVWPVLTREVFGKKRYGKFYGLENTAVGFGSMGFNAMASTMYHTAGTTLMGSDGSLHFVCNGPVCFQQTFNVCAVFCALFAIIPVVALLYWLELERKRKALLRGYDVSTALGGGGSHTFMEAIAAANLMSSQVEVDMEMLRDSGSGDSDPEVVTGDAIRTTEPFASSSTVGGSAKATSSASHRLPIVAAEDHRPATHSAPVAVGTGRQQLPGAPL